jgi:hypothetical protein
MPAFVLPTLPEGTRLEVLEVGAAPLLRRFLELLDLPGLFDRHLPPLRGPQPDLPTATVLGVLLANLQGNRIKTASGLFAGGLTQSRGLRKMPRENGTRTRR